MLFQVAASPTSSWDDLSGRSPEVCLSRTGRGILFEDKGYFTPPLPAWQRLPTSLQVLANAPAPLREFHLIWPCSSQSITAALFLAHALSLAGPSLFLEPHASLPLRPLLLLLLSGRLLSQVSARRRPISF